MPNNSRLKMINLDALTEVTDIVVLKNWITRRKPLKYPIFLYLWKASVNQLLFLGYHMQTTTGEVVTKAIG